MNNAQNHSPSHLLVPVHADGSAHGQPGTVSALAKMLAHLRPSDPDVGWPVDMPEVAGGVQALATSCSGKPASDPGHAFGDSYRAGMYLVSRCRYCGLERRERMR